MCMLEYLFMRILSVKGITIKKKKYMAWVILSFRKPRM